jgi:hypothetical protein
MKWIPLGAARGEEVELTEMERQWRDEIWRKNSTRLAEKLFESALRKLKFLG